jgi:putative transposase
MMPMQGNLTIERMCSLAGVSRAGFYRQWRRQEPRAEEMTVRAAIQEIALAHRRRYGYRRITAELRRRGMAVNHKRVARIMRSDNLLALRRRRFVVTTQSRHEREIYFNLAAQIEVTGPNQLWVADITYIRLQREFVYLAVILDRFSRRVVGWSLDRQCQARLAIGALEQAIAERQPNAGLVHHSDRGIQYACADYVQLLRRHQILPSMSRAGCPFDNAACESFMSTLKREEIYANPYRDLEDLTRNVTEFIECYYNPRRLHSALGYCSPEEFERETEQQSVAAKVSFLRHEEIYQSDAADGKARAGVPPPVGRARARLKDATEGARPAHRLDEFPAGYSSASCSPAELACASPAVIRMQPK